MCWRFIVGGKGPEARKWTGQPRTNSQDPATVLDPFGYIFVELGPDRLSATTV